MFKVYIKATDLIDRLRNDKAGVVSFEYVIVAACIVGAVAAVFGTTLLPWRAVTSDDRADGSRSTRGIVARSSRSPSQRPDDRTRGAQGAPRPPHLSGACI